MKGRRKNLSRMNKICLRGTERVKTAFPYFSLDLDFKKSPCERVIIKIEDNDEEENKENENNQSKTFFSLQLNLQCYLSIL